MLRRLRDLADVRWKRHRQLGIPLVLWRDGQVVEVDPQTVELPELPDEAPDSGD